jgi:hypothetical protein
MCVTKCKKEIYTAVALHTIIKCMNKMPPLHKAFVKVTCKDFYKI